MIVTIEIAIAGICAGIAINPATSDIWVAVTTTWAVMASLYAITDSIKELKYK